MRRGPLQLVELVALTLIYLPSVWSFLIHLPGALRSTGVTRLRHYYGSSDSCRTSVWCPAGLIASCTESSGRSVSNHPPSLRSRGLLFFPYVIRRTAEDVPRNVPHPFARTCWRQLGFAAGAAGSPSTVGRIEFVILRTDHSPPGALHLPSRGRSSTRLRQPGRPPTGTSTLLVQYTCNRTAPRREPGGRRAVCADRVTRGPVAPAPQGAARDHRSRP